MRFLGSVLDLGSLDLRLIAPVEDLMTSRRRC